MQMGTYLCVPWVIRARNSTPKPFELSFSSKAGTIAVCKSGRALDFDERLPNKVLLKKKSSIDITLDDGNSSVTAWGCDLTYDYVKINGDYRT